MRFLVVALVAAPALAVKSYLFRTCDQNPFCNRNRHYEQEALAPGFVSPYTIDAQSVELVNGHFSAVVTKTVGSKAIELPLTIDVESDSTVHIVLDENNRHIDSNLVNAERYSPENAVDASEVRVPKAAIKSKHDSNGAEIAFGNKSTLEIAFSPVKISLSRNGQQQIVLNDRQLLNLEHLRTKEDGDTESNLFESQHGAWTDSFDGKNDNKLKGPESVALDVDFVGYKHVYGIPEHADRLSLKDTNSETGHKDPYRLYNVDIFEYETESTLPMYGSIPFMVANKPGSSAGVLWLNAADTYIDITHEQASTNTHWISENGKLDVYLFVGSTPADVIEAYGHVTGMTALPQAFSIGYHQCRWNYNSADDVVGVNEQFDKAGIPYDVIWLDIEYAERKKYFTWNKDTFPDPDEMMRILDAAKRKLVAIIDPHILKENGYRVYDGITSSSLAVKDNRGNPFEGHCWPGNSVWIDPFNPEGRKYWASLFALGDEFGGNADNLHIWNDMNEPSVFSGPETSAFKDEVHHGGWEHRDIHNIYGQEVVNATFDGMLDRYSHQQRPFVLTRSYFAGSQRLAAMWTGDNQAEWEYLQAATPMILTSGVAGMPFAGADVGGFFRNPEPELLARWYQAGAFYPFFRGHAHIDARRREPYLLDEPYQSAVKHALELRYRLLPTFYTAFYDSSKTLAPVMRPLFYEFPDNEHTYAIDDQFFIGDAIMAKPVVHANTQEIDVYLPSNDFYYDRTGKAHQGPATISVPVDLETIPLFIKGGTIHARRQRPRRSAELMANDPFTLVVAVDGNGHAKGHLYTDDGISYGYEKGEYVLSNFELKNRKITNTVEHSQGPFADLTIERILVLGDSAERASVGNKLLGVSPAAGGFMIRKPDVKIGENWEISF